MSYTFNLSADEGSDALQVSRVRNLLDDVTQKEAKTEGGNYFFSDARILDFLGQVEEEANTARNRAKLAAAIGAEVMATNLDFVVGDKSDLAQEWQRSKNATGLRAQAAAWREEVARSSDGATDSDSSPGVVQRTRADGYARCASDTEYTSGCYRGRRWC